MSGCAHGVVAAFFDHAEITLSGETISGIGAGFSQALVRVRSNGTVEKFTTQDAAWIQIDSATDWIIPNNAAPSTYEVKITEDTGTLNYSGDSVDTWLPVTSNRTWGVQSSTSHSCTATISIRRGSGATLDSASYSLSAFNLP